jgi:hypothetical protein
VVMAEIAVFALAFAVSVATDEGGLTLAVRLGRVAPLVPLVAAVAAYAVMSGVRSRGEERALGALGVPPRSLALACALGAWMAPALTAMAITFGHVDVEGFYPPPPSAPEIHDSDGRFVSDDLGAAIADDGAITAYVAKEPHERRTVRLGLPTHARLAAGLTTFLVGVALSLAFAREKKALLDLVPALVCAAAVIVSFQLAAAGRTSAFASLVPALALLAFELRAYLRAA